MTVYADIAFLINFCMDYVILTFMCRVLSCKTTVLRCTAAACLGGAGAVLVFFISNAAAVFLQILLGALMCIVCAPCRTLKAFAGRLAVLYACAFVFGGGIFALLCAAGADVLLKGGAFYINLNLKILIPSAALCFALICGLERLIKHARPECRRRVRVSFMGKTVLLRGYIDTGNTLTCGGTPVMLVSWSSAKQFFPAGTDSKSFYMHCPPERVRTASYKAVGGGGVIWCAVPDSVYIEGRKTSAVIGICDTPLSSEYDALLPSCAV